MNGRLLYLDSSALVKLVVAESETRALLALLKEYPDRISSALSAVQVHRALRRAGAPAAEHRRATEVLSRVALLRIDDDILKRAAELPPADLRSLDAIHLATALSVNDDLASVVAYDRRLAAAAVRFKVRVVAPGQKA